jgi:diacylglycerol kinase (ATP)
LRWLAVLNPAAHGGTAEARLRWVARELSRRLGAECVWTSQPGQAREIARRGRDFDGCIAVGGDGTIFEVVNGLDLDRQVLGIVPVGTGNGLARALHLLDVHSALRSLCRPHLSRFDLIGVRYRAERRWHECRVVHTSGLGYIAGVVALGVGPLRRLSHLRYAVAACLQCWRQPKFAARLKVDDGPWQELVLTNLAVNNTPHAGHFRLFPEADPQDGRLDLLSGRLSPFSQLFEDLGTVTQTYLFERSHHRPARAVEVELVRPTALMLDGELIPAVDAVQYRALEGRLRCCTAVSRGPGGLKGARSPTRRLPCPLG